MSQGWENYDPAPIEKIHGEVARRFHEVKNEWGQVDGIMFNALLTEFKTKIMKAYGITIDPVPKVMPKNG